MNAKLFEVQHLHKRYGDAEVVKDLSFEIAPGECLGVIGPNGAGKTTTIRMCLGHTVPDGGSIHALGLEMPRDALAIKAALGVVTQFDTLDPDFSCAENLLVYGRYFGMKDAAIQARIPQLLEFASLTSKSAARPGELSGGMKQKLLIAIALGRDAKVLVMGATFKENVSDIRNSKVADVVKELKSFSWCVFYLKSCRLLRFKAEHEGELGSILYFCPVGKPVEPNPVVKSQ